VRPPRLLSISISLTGSPWPAPRPGWCFLWLPRCARSQLSPPGARQNGK